MRQYIGIKKTKNQSKKQRKNQVEAELVSKTESLNESDEALFTIDGDNETQNETTKSKNQKFNRNKDIEKGLKILNQKKNKNHISPIIPSSFIGTLDSENKIAENFRDNTWNIPRNSNRHPPTRRSIVKEDLKRKISKQIIQKNYILDETTSLDQIEVAINIIVENITELIKNTCPLRLRLEKIEEYKDELLKIIGEIEGESEIQESEILSEKSEFPESEILSEKSENQQSSNLSESLDKLIKLEESIRLNIQFQGDADETLSYTVDLVNNSIETDDEDDKVIWLANTKRKTQRQRVNEKIQLEILEDKKKRKMQNIEESKIQSLKKKDGEINTSKRSLNIEKEGEQKKPNFISKKLTNRAIKNAHRLKKHFIVDDGARLAEALDNEDLYSFGHSVVNSLATKFL